jgi:hypothetical protein
VRDTVEKVLSRSLGKGREGEVNVSVTLLWKGGEATGGEVI